MVQNILSDLNLIWIDLEMTGLNPDKDRILEIATVVTDPNLNIIAEGPVLAIHQSEEIILSMNSWCKKAHKKSGLTEKVRNSTINEKRAEESTLSFLRQYVKENISPMCGNTICQDRRFLFRYMPTLERYFHYRHIDVTTVKELARRWFPQSYVNFDKEAKHIALEDIKDSINELKYYKQNIFK